MAIPEGSDRVEKARPQTRSPPHAQKLIKAFPRVAESKFVFTTTGRTPISGWSRAKEKLDELMVSQLKARGRGDGDREVELKQWGIHDLRRTAATGMDRLGVKQQVVEAMLGHNAGSKAGITGIYQLHTYEVEKRDAIDRWTKHVASLIRAGRRSDIREREFLAS